MKNFVQSVDEWLRRCLRICKCWKKVKTKFNNLIKCKIDRKILGNGQILERVIGALLKVRYYVWHSQMMLYEWLDTLFMGLL